VSTDTIRTRHRAHIKHSYSWRQRNRQDDTFKASHALASLKNWHAWEHKHDHTLLYKQWLEVATQLKDKKENGILFIDDAHNHILEVNALIDLLANEVNTNLKLILASARNQWNPRVKTPNIFKRGKQHILKGLDTSEIEDLLTLVDTNPELKPLVENNFSGFSRAERKRRLTVRCESDTFVCLKNIFASEKFDDIVLRDLLRYRKTIEKFIA